LVEKLPVSLGGGGQRLASRWAVAPWVLAFLHLHFHIHHYHGPAIDYGALAIASFASFVGVPGPGEAVLIAAAVLAARHNLGIVSVLAVAFVGATVGGIAGYVAGRWAGRGLWTVPGPLRKLRIRAIDRGEKIFARYTVLAVILTPSWIAGIHRVRLATYNIINVISAVVWAGGIGMAAYLVGPSVIDTVQDLGTALTVIGAVALAALIVAGVLRRWRKRARTVSG
jgi:membrane protein DedA with SNARE-associated domain